MAPRPPPRFPLKLVTGVTQSMVDGLEAIAADQERVLTVSDLVRMGITSVLRSYGQWPQRPAQQMNGGQARLPAIAR